MAGSVLLMYLSELNVHPGSALTLVWVTNAIPRPPSKRSAAIALVNGFGNIGTLWVLNYEMTVFRALPSLWIESALLCGKQSGARIITSQCLSGLLVSASACSWHSVGVSRVSSTYPPNFVPYRTSHPADHHTRESTTWWQSWICGVYSSHTWACRWSRSTWRNNLRGGSREEESIQIFVLDD